MSMLIDRFVNDEYNVNVEIDGKWYIAKPKYISMPLTRLIDAYNILIGKARAIHYKEDEL